MINVIDLGCYTKNGTKKKFDASINGEVSPDMRTQKSGGRGWFNGRSNARGDSLTNDRTKCADKLVRILHT